MISLAIATGATKMPGNFPQGVLCTMKLSSRILGQTVVRQITDKAGAPLLKVGSDVFYRHDFAQIECFNFLAAANLSRILDDVPVKNLRDLFERVAPQALILPRLGVVTLAVLGAAFEVRGIGGASPLESWMTKHSTAPDAPDGFITFDTLKHRAVVRDKPARVRSGSKRSRAPRRSRSYRPVPALAADIH